MSNTSRSISEYDIELQVDYLENRSVVESKKEMQHFLLDYPFLWDVMKILRIFKIPKVCYSKRILLICNFLKRSDWELPLMKF